jgi:hypothetical protein
MIGKVVIGKSFNGCVRYVMEKPGAQVLDQSGVRSRTAAEAIEDFNTYRKAKPNVKNAVMHSSISFAHQDKVDNDLMMRIGRDYVEKMDMQDHQYLLVRHQDTQHEHMHIISNRIGYNGEVASDRWCKNRAAHACDELEVKYGLTIAREQGKNKTTLLDKVPVKKRLKEEISGAIEKGLDEGIYDLDGLAEHLSAAKISVEVKTQRTGRINGISFEKEGMAFKGSAISRDFSYGRLQKKLEENQRINNIRNRGIGFGAELSP